MNEKVNTYQCAMCGGIFETEWTDEEAIEELHEAFGEVMVDDCEIVCDDCYKKIMGDDVMDETTVTVSAKEWIRLKKQIANGNK